MVLRTWVVYETLVVRNESPSLLSVSLSLPLRYKYPMASSSAVDITASPSPSKRKALAAPLCSRTHLLLDRIWESAKSPKKSTHNCRKLTNKLFKVKSMKLCFLIDPPKSGRRKDRWWRKQAEAKSFSNQSWQLKAPLSLSLLSLLSLSSLSLSLSLFLSPLSVSLLSLAWVPLLF